MKPSAESSAISPSSPPDGSGTAIPFNAGTASSDPLDEAVLELASQAAFLQGFAERLAQGEPPVEELPVEGAAEIDYGWRAGLP